MKFQIWKVIFRRARRVCFIKESSPCLENSSRASSPSTRKSRRQRTLFDFDDKSSKLKSLEDQQQQPDFWNNDEKARVALQEMKALKTQVEPWRQLEKEAGSHLELAQMLEEAGEEDESARREIEETTAKLEQRFEDLEFRRMMSDPQDVSNCYLYIHPGAGGHRVVRLGRHAASHVSALVRVEGLLDGVR